MTKKFKRHHGVLSRKKGLYLALLDYFRRTVEDSLEGVKLKTDTIWKITVIFKGKAARYKLRQ